MKRYILYILPVLAVLFGFTACSSDEDITDNGQNTELTGDDVIVKAGIGANSVFTRSNPIGTTEEQAKFNEGDIIMVSIIGNKRGVYKLTNGAWVDYSNSENYKSKQYYNWESLKWNSNTQSFYAFYPLEDVKYSSSTNSAPYYRSDNDYYCKIKTDQSTEDALEKSDIMFAKAVDVTKPANHTVTFNFERQTARVIVKLSYNNQFNGLKPTVGSLSVYGGSYMAAGFGFGVIDSYDQISPFKKQDNEYVVLVCPRDGKTDQTFLEMTINHDADADGKTSTDLTLTGTQTLEKGKSYTFNVTVGKKGLTIESVTVDPWTDGGALADGEATQQ